MGHTLELYSDDLRLHVGCRASQYASPARKMANNDIASLYRYALRCDRAWIAPDMVIYWALRQWVVRNF